jgi:PKD repeat protein
MFDQARPGHRARSRVRRGLAMTLRVAFAVIPVACFCLFLAPHPVGAGQSPLTASLTASPTTVTVGQAVNFVFQLQSNAGPDVGITVNSIDFGDGNSIDAGIGGAGTQPIGWPSHAYDQPGTYTARLDGTTSDGASASSTVAITVLARPTAPNISLKSNPASPSVGQSVSFDYSISGLPDSAGSMQLAFGDGTSQQLSGASGSASHSYSKNGTYPAILVVTDQTGQVLGAGSTTVQVGG